MKTLLKPDYTGLKYLYRVKCPRTWIHFDNGKKIESVRMIRNKRFIYGEDFRIYNKHLSEDDVALVEMLGGKTEQIKTPLAKPIKKKKEKKIEVVKAEEVFTKVKAKKQRIFFSQRGGLDAWGGGSKILWYLEKGFEKRGFGIVDKIDECDIVFVNSHNYEFDPEELKDKFVVHRVDGVQKLMGREKRFDEKCFKINEYEDLVIFQTEWSRQCFLDTGWREKKNVVIINGTDKNIFKFKRMNKKENFKVLAVSWSMNEKKGFEFFNWYGCKNNKTTFTFIGRKPYNLTATYIKEALDASKLAKEYQNNNILLFPSKNDPCPNTMIESISCGTPVIALNSGGNKEIVQNRYGILFDDKDDFDEKFRILRKNYNEYVDNIKNDNPFDMNHMVNKYAEAINDNFNKL